MSRRFTWQSRQRLCLTAALFSVAGCAAEHADGPHRSVAGAVPSHLLGEGDLPGDAGGPSVSTEGLPPPGAVLHVTSLNPTSTAGTRLRPRVIDIGDQDLLVDWWDTELNTSCSFTLAADGETRCLPRSGAQLLGPGQEARPTCWQISGPSSGFARVRVDDSTLHGLLGGVPACEQDSYSYFVFEVLAPGTGGDFGCPTDPALGAMLGRQVPLAHFVRAARTAEAVEARRLGLSVLLAEDGARELLGVYDTELEGACRFKQRDYSERTCVPETVIRSRRIEARGADCKAVPDLLRSSVGRCRQAPRFIVEDAKRDVFAADEVRDQSGIYQGSETKCSAVEQDPLYHYFRAGSQIATLTTLKTVSLGDPVQVSFFTDQGQALAPKDFRAEYSGETIALGQMATAFAEPCRLYPLVSGDWACDNLALAWSEYGDAECTEVVLSGTHCRDATGACNTGTSVRLDAGPVARIGECSADKRDVYVKSPWTGRCELSYQGPVDTCAFEELATPGRLILPLVTR